MRIGPRKCRISPAPSSDGGACVSKAIRAEKLAPTVILRQAQDDVAIAPRPGLEPFPEVVPGFLALRLAESLAAWEPCRNRNRS